MASAVPIIFTNTPPVTITTANSSLTYDMIIATLNYVAYDVKRLYMEASTPSQVSCQFQYSTVRPDGQQYALNTNGNLDPYQYLYVLDLIVNDGKLIFDNLSVLGFNLQPSATLEMYFFTDSVSFSYGLDGDGGGGGDAPAPVKQKELDCNRIFQVAAISSLVILTLMYLFNNKKNE